MKVYDIYKIMSAEYENPWSLGDQVVVYETYINEQAAIERVKKLNDARDDHDKKFLAVEVRDQERQTIYLVCKFPSIYDEDKFMGTDAACHEHGYKTRGEAERRTLELNGGRDPSGLDGVVYTVLEWAV